MRNNSAVFPPSALELGSFSSMQTPQYRGNGVCFCKKRSSFPGLALRFFRARTPVPRKWGLVLKENVPITRVGAPFLPCTDPSTEEMGCVYERNGPPFRGLDLRLISLPSPLRGG